MFGIGVFADTGIEPRYNNAEEVRTFFTIDSNGIAKVTTSFTGGESITGATIKIKIQKLISPKKEGF